MTILPLSFPLLKPSIETRAFSSSSNRLIASLGFPISNALQTSAATNHGSPSFCTVRTCPNWCNFGAILVRLPVRFPSPIGNVENKNSPGHSPGLLVLRSRRLCGAFSVPLDDLHEDAQKSRLWGAQAVTRGIASRGGMWYHTAVVKRLARWRPLSLIRKRVIA